MLRRRSSPPPPAGAGAAPRPGRWGRATAPLAAGAVRLGRAVVASRWVRWGFLAVAVFGGAAALAPHRHAIVASAGQIGAGAVLAGSAAALAGLAATLQAWRAILAGLGSDLPAAKAAQVFFVGQLGKYIPGSVWPIVAQMELARAHAVPRHRSSTAALLTMFLSLAAGLLTAAATLPAALAGRDARYWWLLATVPVVAAALHPRLINGALALALRATHRPPPARPIPGRAVLAATGWSVMSWLLFGTHVWLLLAPLAYHPGQAAAISVGGFALAWCAGFLLVVAPAGAGARDVLLIALLTTQTGAAEAAAVALLSRAVMTVADVLLAGAAALTARPPRQPPDPDATG
ncbi:lysylphosphatidylglycerol synthase domain-containing protein [Dactylosporangium sp. CA-139066]|uniref:lysylphosphatidylglycerol synthase domain-containing protein n=1 Tax=Dactylosporangium sp. CA-139066 TaxID=3239930 RepID=UPI003D9266C4